MNLRGIIPTFIWLTEGEVKDMNGLDVVLVEPGVYYLLYKGFVNFYSYFILLSTIPICVNQS